MRHVPHVYLPGPWSGDAVPLESGTRHHLERVVRLEPGGAVSYTDGAGTGGSGIFRGGAIERGAESSPVPPTARLTIAVAPPRATERQRFLVEKLGELGVDRLVWLQSRYGEGKPPRPDKGRAWAIGALEQSRGRRLMETGETAGLSTLAGLVWVADPGAPPPGPPPGDLTVCIGPEGGFHPEEIPAGFLRVGLGERVLRTETASLVAAALALYHMQRLG